MPRVNNETPGLIYYLLDASRMEQRLKVGYTTDLKSRLSALAAQTLSRQSPLVLALEAGTPTEERERHARFADYRLMGEWFRYEGEVAAYVRTLPNPLGWLGDCPDLWRYAGGWQSFTGWKDNQPDIEEMSDFANVRF